MMLILVWSNLYLLFNLVVDAPETDFNDLGNLLLGGVAIAVVFAIAFTFLRLKLRDKRPATSNFISIATQREEE